MCKDKFEIKSLDLVDYNTIFKHTEKKIQDTHPKCQYDYLKLKKIKTPIYNHEYTELINTNTILELIKKVTENNGAKQKKIAIGSLKTVREVSCNYGFITDSLFPVLRYGLGYTGYIYNKYKYDTEQQRVLPNSQAISTKSKYVLFDYSYSLIEAVALLCSHILQIPYNEVHTSLNNSYSELDRLVIGKLFIDCIQGLDTVTQIELLSSLIKKNLYFKQIYNILIKEINNLKGHTFPIPIFFKESKNINQRERIYVRSEIDILKLHLISIMIPVINSIIFSFSNHKKRFLPNNISGGVIFRSCSDLRIIIEEFSELDSLPILNTEYGAIFKPKKYTLITPEDLDNKYLI